MFPFVLILLLVAAVFGVLGAVLKVALVIVLSIVLAVTALVVIATWYLRRRVRAFQHQFEATIGRQQRRRGAYDVDAPGDDPPPGALGPGDRPSP